MKHPEIILTGLIISLLFTGCSADEQTNTKNTNPETAEITAEKAASEPTEANRYSELENYIAQKRTELREDYDFDITFMNNTFHIIYTEMEMKNTDGKGYEAAYVHTANFDYTIGETTGKYRYHNEQNVYQHGKKIVSNSFAFNADIYVNDYPKQSSVEVTQYDNVPEEASANILSSGGEIFNHMMDRWNQLCLEPNQISFQNIGFLCY